jgi:hypothetical protein
MALAAWRVGDDRPERVSRSEITLERDLEDWIEADPGLVLEGLVIVGRQVPLAGGRLDLLGIDLVGRWVVVELKPGRLYRDVITQALDYVASVRSLPPQRLRSIAQSYLETHPNPDASRRLDDAFSDDEDSWPPQVTALVVGTDRDPGLDRLIEFLATGHGVDIEAVTFEVFGLADGRMIMVREIAETAPGPEPVPEDDKLKAVLAQAQKNGDRAIFEDFLAAGTRLGLHARPYKVSVMFTAPTNKTRMLFTIWTKPGGTPMWTSSETFEEFFPGISTDQARRHLGPDGRRELDQHSAAQFLSGLEDLFAESQLEVPGSSGSG